MNQESILPALHAANKMYNACCAESSCRIGQMATNTIVCVPRQNRKSGKHDELNTWQEDGKYDWEYRLNKTEQSEEIEKAVM